MRIEGGPVDNFGKLLGLVETIADFLEVPRCETCGVHGTYQMPSRLQMIHNCSHTESRLVTWRDWNAKPGDWGRRSAEQIEVQPDSTTVALTEEQTQEMRSWFND